MQIINMQINNELQEKINQLQIKIKTFKQISSHEIRAIFIEYFMSMGHKYVQSSKLFNPQDHTILFTNAGMNQFKGIFLGIEDVDYSRAVSSQKCIRAGGKHNDLENVGYTKRHHTFFEMLGNFSFGDYFKQQAIIFAWEFLTKILCIDQNKLHVTVYYKDQESFLIWRDYIKLDSKKIILFGEKQNGSSDNFWQMADTGPCGPSTEIFYDYGEQLGESFIDMIAQHEGGNARGDNCLEYNDKYIYCGENAEKFEDRYIEIWNCVFMEYQRDESGALHKLPKPSVDTGMGLERITAVMQTNDGDNYKIDTFQTIILAIINLTQNINHEHNHDNIDGIQPQHKIDIQPQHKIIADHIRTLVFGISDGARFSNEGRGYVLRRIARRAMCAGYQLGIHKAFLHDLVDVVIDLFATHYAELRNNLATVKEMILIEEEKFLKTLSGGFCMLEAQINKIKQVNTGAELEDIAGTASEPLSVLSGEFIFKMYDTFGFPIDIMQDICKAHNVQLDIFSFEQHMQEQRNNAREANKNKFKLNVSSNAATNASLSELSNLIATPMVSYESLNKANRQHDNTNCGNLFLGYQQNSLQDATILQIELIAQDKQTDAKSTQNKQGHHLATQDKTADNKIMHDRYVIITDKTVCYSEGGGQIGDAGRIEIIADKHGNSLNSVGSFIILDTQKSDFGFMHYGFFANINNTYNIHSLIGARVAIEIDVIKRNKIARNHTATHILHSVLMKILGDDIKQKGSLVNDNISRFDFNYHQQLPEDIIYRIEDEVNQLILNNLAVSVENMSYQDAIKQGAIGLFGEKYNLDNVRVVTVSGQSSELCGGTHVERTGEIGIFKIIKEESVGSGIRRIEFATGDTVARHVRRIDGILKNIKQSLSANTNEDIIQKLCIQADNYTSLNKINEKHKRLLIHSWLYSLNWHIIANQMTSIQHAFVLPLDIANVELVVEVIANDVCDNSQFNKHLIAFEFICNNELSYNLLSNLMLELTDAFKEFFANYVGLFLIKLIKQEHLLSQQQHLATEQHISQRQENPEYKQENYLQKAALFLASHDNTIDQSNVVVHKHKKTTDEICVQNTFYEVCGNMNILANIIKQHFAAKGGGRGNFVKLIFTNTNNTNSTNMSNAEIANMSNAEIISMQNILHILYKQYA